MVVTKLLHQSPPGFQIETEIKWAEHEDPHRVALGLPDRPFPIFCLPLLPAFNHPLP